MTQTAHQISPAGNQSLQVSQQEFLVDHPAQAIKATFDSEAALPRSGRLRWTGRWKSSQLESRNVDRRPTRRSPESSEWQLWLRC
jgi:hypothetical protein